MDLAAIEEELRGSVAGAILADPRLVRRVIKSHRNLSGLSFSVPHAHCYALRRDALRAIIDLAELGSAGQNLPEMVILLARPLPREVAKKTPDEVLSRLVRAAFHARVHLRIEQRIDNGQLSEPAIRERIDRIGQTEFDEIRAILRHDELLFPPYGDREAYTEFAALYLELRHFAPALLPVTFPALLSRDDVDGVLAADVDARALLGQSPAQRSFGSLSDGAARAEPAGMAASSRAPARTPSAFQAKWRLRLAERARQRGNIARATLLAASAARVDDPDLRAKADTALRYDLGTLADRLELALRAPAAPDSDSPSRDEWISALSELAGRAVLHGVLRQSASARLLHDLERAAREGEEELRTIDVVTWALSRGARPLVRPLPATREVRIARQMRIAAEASWDVEVVPGEPKHLASHPGPASPKASLPGSASPNANPPGSASPKANLLRWASRRADDNVSTVLRPKILDVLTTVGLTPASAPERIAEYKLVEELLDQAVARGFIHLAHLRDALSKNQLKLDDLKSPRELYAGDPLLRADALFAVTLDGVYRGGEIYLRLLQKLSSLAFGTRIGRIVSLYVLLPFGGAFVLLEGIGHLVAPLARALELGPVPILTPISFLVTAVVLFGLVHSETVRRGTRRALRIVGRILAAVFLEVPRWLLTRPSVRRFLQSRPVRFAIRRIFVPLVITALLVLLTPLAAQPPLVAMISALGIFVLTVWASGTSAALFAEDVVLDWLGPTWRTLSGQLLPGLFRLIAGLFRFLLDGLERAINRVDEWLRIRRDPWRATIALKAALGLVWFFVAYAIRLYTTLLVEPEINPLKHFPVVTVAHKLLLPVSPEMLSALGTALSPLGSFVGGTIAATTVFLVPSVFGFLVWELKENRKLYRASRKKTLQATRVGHHGETVAQLMIPGFHSGTLPKLYDRLRRAAQRGELGGAAGEADAIRRFREGISSVEEAIVQFTERELIALLHSPTNVTPRWTHGPLRVERVLLGSNRLRIRIACRRLAGGACEIAFDEQSGLLVASITEAGFLTKISSSSDARVLLENALAGFYQFAGVDLVREQIRAALGPMHYDIADEGLLVWPDEAGYRTEVVYPLRGTKVGALIHPRVRGVALSVPPRPLDARSVLFRRQAIAWADWVRAWDAAERLEGPLPRLMYGASLLP